MDLIEIAEKRKQSFQFDIPRDEQLQVLPEVLKYLANADPETQKKFKELEKDLRAELDAMRRGLKTASNETNSSVSVSASSPSRRPAMFDTHEGNDQSSNAVANADEAQFSFPSYGGGLKPVAPSNVAQTVLLRDPRLFSNFYLSIAPLIAQLSYE